MSARVLSGRKAQLRFLLVSAFLIAIAAYAIAAWGQIPSTQPRETASMKVEGHLVKIQGRYYVIKDARGKEIYLLISPDTELSGTFNVGDWIEVWTSPIEHAIAIRASAPDDEAPVMETATHTLKGTLLGIEGKYYVMRGADGKDIRLLVNQDTELAGEFSPGDEIEVFTSPVEHAVAIKSPK